MNSDIVTRLREIALEERPLWRSPMIEAADEIERLQTENNDLRNIFSRDVSQQIQDEMYRMAVEIMNLRIENKWLRERLDIWQKVATND